MEPVVALHSGAILDTEVFRKPVQGCAHVHEIEVSGAPIVQFQYIPHASRRRDVAVQLSLRSVLRQSLPLAFVLPRALTLLMIPLQPVPRLPLGGRLRGQLLLVGRPAIRVELELARRFNSSELFNQ